MKPFLAFAASTFLLTHGFGVAADPTAKEALQHRKLPDLEEVIASLEGTGGEGLRAVQVGEPPQITVPLHFKYDSVELTTAEERAWLRDVAVKAFQTPRFERHVFVIEGHTDSRGEPSYNLELSQRRADTIRDLLISLGVSPDRLRASGKGEFEPVAEGENEDAYQQNRRVIFIRQ